MTIPDDVAETTVGPRGNYGQYGFSTTVISDSEFDGNRYCLEQSIANLSQKCVRATRKARSLTSNLLSVRAAAAKAFVCIIGVSLNVPYVIQAAFFFITFDKESISPQQQTQPASYHYTIYLLLNESPSSQQPRVWRRSRTGPSR